jgi:hypothetical protein
MSTIGSYIEDLNDPIAHKIEAILGSSNMQVRLDKVNAMKPAFLTDYYKRVNNHYFVPLIACSGDE